MSTTDAVFGGHEANFLFVYYAGTIYPITFTTGTNITGTVPAVPAPVPDIPLSIAVNIPGSYISTTVTPGPNATIGTINYTFGSNTYSGDNFYYTYSLSFSTPETPPSRLGWSLTHAPASAAFVPPPNFYLSSPIEFGTIVFSLTESTCQLLQLGGNNLSTTVPVPVKGGLATSSSGTFELPSAQFNVVIPNIDVYDEAAQAQYQQNMVVYFSDTTSPLTGLLSESGPDGWSYDMLIG